MRYSSGEFTERTQNDVRRKLEAETKISEIVLPTLKETITLLRAKMEEFSKAEELDDEKVSFAHSYALFSLPAGPKTRLEIDAYTRAEISGYAKKFQESVKYAMGNLLLLAEARGLDGATLNERRERLEKDSLLHATEFKVVLERGQISFRTAQNYRELLGSATLMRNELRAVVKDLTGHLEHVANKEILRK